MAKTSSLAAKLAANYPDITLALGDDFRWSPEETTVYYLDADDAGSCASLLHETGHALLGHTDFKRDIELIKIERAAWDEAIELGPRYGITLSPETIEEMLDTYRDWLHARSTCPACSLTGAQTGDNDYRCLNCGQEWGVNDARRCALRRYNKTP